MQVRFANRQDEPNVRTFVESVYAENGKAVDLDGSDSDLRNIEAQYFGQEGLVIVAEEDKQIFGIAAARRKSESVLELRRLLVAKAHREGELAAQMIAIIVSFAPRMLYEKIVDGRTGVSESQGNEFAEILTNAGFSRDKNEDQLALSVTADF